MAAAAKPAGWDPHKMYDVSPEERRLIEERGRRRAQMKKEFQKKVTNPYTRSGGGYFFDPAMQRFLSMRFDHWAYFKATPKTLGFSLFMCFVPFLVLYKVRTYDLARKEKLYRTGQIAYYDRMYKSRGP